MSAALYSSVVRVVILCVPDNDRESTNLASDDSAIIIEEITVINLLLIPLYVLKFKQPIA